MFWPISIFVVVISEFSIVELLILALFKLHNRRREIFTWSEDEEIENNYTFYNEISDDNSKFTNT